MDATQFIHYPIRKHKVPFILISSSNHLNFSLPLSSLHPLKIKAWPLGSSRAHGEALKEAKIITIINLLPFQPSSSTLSYPSHLLLLLCRDRRSSQHPGRGGFDPKPI